MSSSDLVDNYEINNKKEREKIINELKEIIKKPVTKYKIIKN